MVLTNRKKVAIIRDGYREFHRILYECDNKYRVIELERIKEYRKIIGRIESAIYHLNHQDHFIIYNEIILGKTGNWYLEYFSESTYRRHAKIAYENFLRMIEN